MRSTVPRPLPPETPPTSVAPSRRNLQYVHPKPTKDKTEVPVPVPSKQQGGKIKYNKKRKYKKSRKTNRRRKISKRSKRSKRR